MHLAIVLLGHEYQPVVRGQEHRDTERTDDGDADAPEQRTRNEAGRGSRRAAASAGAGQLRSMVAASR